MFDEKKQYEIEIEAQVKSIALWDTVLQSIQNLKVMQYSHTGEIKLLNHSLTFSFIHLKPAFSSLHSFTI